MPAAALRPAPGHGLHRAARVLLASGAALALVAACGEAEPAARTAVERDAPPGGEASTGSSTTAAQDGATTTTTGPPATTTTAPADPYRLSPPAAATEPAALAHQIVEAETAIRDPEVTGVALARAALSQQVAYRRLGAHPDWDDAVLGAVPPELHPTVRRHAWARREFRGMHTTLSDTLPAWRIVEPPPPDELLAHYQDAEAAFGIPWRYLAAINLVETGFGRIRGTSVAGARGPMQFMPATWEAYGEGDVDDPRDAILAAGRYLAANGGATDIDNALWHYNHSDRYVRGVKLYADLIAEHERAFEALHMWGVWYLSTAGEAYLPVGYEAHEPVDAATYLASTRTS